jgi:LysR family glycine cleavage system transcriptional activator
MTFNQPPLPWLRAFEASARLGSFTLAASELALTPAAISHQIRSLEAHLGYPLFLRRNRQILLTRLGESYLPAVRQAFGDLSLATTDIFGRTERVGLRVRCLQSFAQAWLIPRLPRFRAAHPEVRLQLHTAAWAGTLESEQLDLDIAYGSGGWAGVAASPLLSGSVLPLATPDMAADIPDLATLAHAPLIEIAGAGESWTRFFHRQSLPPPPKAPVMVVDQSSVALDMAAQGAGVALVFDAFAAPYLEDGRLVQVTGAKLQQDQGMYLLRSTAQTPSADLSLFTDWLQAEAEK